ncbi:unnamed protein product [Litomosoides sigmodontis]|uniref:Uncharacterized protein n=1 Tax=Litomosoides sigmodontis TaxID=42156 RepID=A0A3P6V630_LITSI|nr:unnamed protein product [Litomosoides sigmodontis]
MSVLFCGPIGCLEQEPESKEAQRLMHLFAGNYCRIVHSAFIHFTSYLKLAEVGELMAYTDELLKIVPSYPIGKWLRGRVLSPLLTSGGIVARMMKFTHHDKMIQLKGCDFRQHPTSTNQQLRELRVKRDRVLLLNCQYKAVAAVIDWMYAREVANSLGADQLQEILDTALQLFASQTECAMCCINAATDPQCSVGYFPHRLTLIKRVLKHSAHSRRFLDAAVLGSFYIELLRSSNDLLALIHHLRRLYRELPRSLLVSIRIHICNKRPTVCTDSNESNGSTLPAQCSVSEVKLECKSAEIGKMIGTKADTLHIAEIDSSPTFEEPIKISSSQEFTDACIFTFKHFSGQIANFSGQHRMRQEEEFCQHSTNTGR